MLSTGSHPTRVRGLKPTTYAAPVKRHPVAPHAGAWIETALRACVRRTGAVALHAGAWIETCMEPTISGHPCPVAPHAGAWIEMGRLERSCKPACHDAPLRIHDLKLPTNEYPKAGLKSEPPA